MRSEKLDKVVIAVKDGELIKSFATSEGFSVSINNNIEKDIVSTKIGKEFIDQLVYEQKEPFTLSDLKRS